MKVFFKFFQGLSVAKNCLRPKTALLTILTIKREHLCKFTKTLCNFTITLKGRLFMGHNGTGLKFSIIIDL